MKPPCKFKITREHGFSLCLGCNEWKKCLAFYHDGMWWALCYNDWEEYWYNQDELNSDYKPPLYKGKFM